MELLLVRHAIAKDRVSFALTKRPDTERPLTDHGRKKFKRSLKGLTRVAPRIDIIAASPYKRARQTADLLAKAFPQAKRLATSALAHGGNPRAFVTWLRKQKRDPVVA